MDLAGSQRRCALQSEVKEEDRASPGPGDTSGAERTAAASHRPPVASLPARCPNHTERCAIGVSGTGYPAAPKVVTMALLVSK